MSAASLSAQLAEVQRQLDACHAELDRAFGERDAAQADLARDHKREATIVDALFDKVDHVTALAVVLRDVAQAHAALHTFLTHYYPEKVSAATVEEIRKTVEATREVLADPEVERLSDYIIDTTIPAFEPPDLTDIA